MELKAPVKGTLLVSEPSIIGDASFSRSVIFLTEFDQNGAVGFILNKPMDCTMDEIIPEFDIPLTVYQGGPVEMDNLYFLHRVPHLIPDSHLISNGIYWGGDFKEVCSLFKEEKITSDDIKFFLGYSGWDQEQLNEEIDNHSWVLKNNQLDDELLSSNIHDLWKREMINLGGEYEIWSNAPENPSLN